MQIQNWPVEKLIDYARNPRKNDEVISKMTASIKEFGFRLPLLIKSDGLIIDGHLRKKAAVALGMTELPCIVADDLTETQIKAFRLVANQSANWASWDTELLKLELEDLKLEDFDLDLIGFEDLGALGFFDVNETEPPELSDGEKSEFEQITFTLHNEQAEVVKEALGKVIETGSFDGEINQNKNGNAIHFICAAFLNGF